MLRWCWIYENSPTNVLFSLRTQTVIHPSTHTLYYFWFFERTSHPKVGERAEIWPNIWNILFVCLSTQHLAAANLEKSASLSLFNVSNKSWNSCSRRDENLPEMNFPDILVTCYISKVWNICESSRICVLMGYLLFWIFAKYVFILQYHTCIYVSSHICCMENLFYDVSEPSN